MLPQRSVKLFLCQEGFSESELEILLLVRHLRKGILTYTAGSCCMCSTYCVQASSKKMTTRKKVACGLTGALEFAGDG